MMRIILITLIASLSLSSQADPKPYQKVLMNEPVSLLDMTVFNTKLKLTHIINQRVRSLGIFNTDYDKLKWVKEPEGMTYNPELRAINEGVTFNYAEGRFLVNLSFIYLNTDKRLIPNQKNYAAICKMYLDLIAVGVPVEPYAHEGYTNSSLETLGNGAELYAEVLKDTDHKVEVLTGWLKKNIPVVECKYTGDQRPSNSTPTYNFKGDWHRLD